MAVADHQVPETAMTLPTARTELLAPRPRTCADSAGGDGMSRRSVVWKAVAHVVARVLEPCFLSGVGPTWV